ncbi:MAG TPA: ankyrin repeat domain-containing protein [Aldersonia sp.]
MTLFARSARSRLALAALAGMVPIVASCGTAPPADAPEPSPATAATSETGATAPPPPTSPSRLSDADRDQLNRDLIAASWADDVPRAAALIDAGADVNFEDETQQSAFLIAASEGYYDLLELTLARGANLAALDSYNGTALIRAAERGHWDVCGRLIRAGIALDHVNYSGWTALHEAVVYGDGRGDHLDTVRVLIAGGANLDIASTRAGAVPAEHAAAQGQVDVERLLRAGPTWTLPDAAAAGDADAVAWALRTGTDSEVRDEAGRTPLLLAVTNDRVPAARVLTTLGADPNALDDRHDTPWLVTGVTGSVAMADVLLPAHPDLAIVNRFGGTSIIPASERGHVEYVRRIAGTGIDLDHVNYPGWTALLEAVVYGDGSARYQQVVAALLAAGADPAIPDAAGLTAHEHAVSRGQTEIATLLAPG